jgi:hypothetical protein
MEWGRASNDEIDLAIDHFSSLASAGLARVCELIAEIDSRQSWMTDGARNLTDWVASRMRIRHSPASQLVAVAKPIVDLPVLSRRFDGGEVSLDQVDAISRVATPGPSKG